LVAPDNPRFLDGGARRLRLNTEGNVMLRPISLRAALPLASVAALAVYGLSYGCSSTTEAETGAGASGPVSTKKPPPPPDGASAGDGSGAVFAVSKLFVGDTDRTGKKDQNAWKTYGYDLDGKISTNASTDVCKPAPGGSKTIHDDGENGTDNAFGKKLVPLIAQALKGQGVDSPSTEVTSQIEEGKFSILLRLDKLGAKPSYIDIAGFLYAGADLGHKPNWAQEKWPVFDALLTDPKDIDSTKVKFPKSYVNEHVWVSGAPATLDLALSIGGVTLTLTINNALISMKMSTDRKTVREGTIAGIIATKQLVTEIEKVAGSLGFCDEALVKNISGLIIGAADILSDGTQDPSKECNGISVGLGFDALAIGGLGDVVESTATPGNPCEGGGGTGGDGTGGAGGGTGGTGGGTGGAGGAK
jgi:hypothetical protein